MIREFSQETHTGENVHQTGGKSDVDKARKDSLIKMELEESRDPAIRTVQTPPHREFLDGRKESQ